MCALNLNKGLKILFYMFEMVFATPVVNHMERPELLRCLYRQYNAEEGSTRCDCKNVQLAGLP